MKLSIIVPVYNVENYLPVCLDSILSQNFNDYEIIMINDGSKDSSYSIMEEYKSRFPDKIINLSVDNGGQGRARNFALDIARGDYIAFADSDDWVTPDMFSKLYAAAVSENADIAVCDYYRVEDGENIYEKSHLQNHYLSCAGAVWNKIFRKTLVGDVRFPEGRWYEDFAFSAKMLMRSEKTVFINEPLYCYRSGHTSTMRNKNSAKNLDMIYILDDIRAAMPEGREEDFRFLVLNHLLLDSIKRVSTQKGEGYKDVINEMREYVKKYIPNLTSCESFKSESRGRRIVMWLNYHGFEDAANALLTLAR